MSSVNNNTNPTSIVAPASADHVAEHSSAPAYSSFSNDSSAVPSGSPLTLEDLLRDANIPSGVTSDPVALLGDDLFAGASIPMVSAEYDSAIKSKSTPPMNHTPALSFTASPPSPFDNFGFATPHTGMLGVMDLDSAEIPLFGYDMSDMSVYVPAGADDKAPSYENNASSLDGLSALGLQGISPFDTLVPSLQVTSPTDDGELVTISTPSELPAAPLPNVASDFALHSPRSTESPLGGSSKVTGHRRNLQPAALLPVNAPTQTRNYHGPSSTSKKDVPAFALTSTSRKRKSNEVDFDDEEAEEDDSAVMGLNEIEAKRRQNTLAARRSRHRKLQYVRELEEKVQTLEDINRELYDRLRVFEDAAAMHGH